MDKTDCLDLPYPECSPPLVKDASDIVHFKNLADAVDVVVNDFATELDDQLLTIDAINVSGTVVSNAPQVTHFFNVAPSFDNGGLYDAARGVIRPQKDGWYAVGGWVSASHASLPSSGNVRVEPLVNGLTVTARQGPSHPAVGAEYVAWTDILYLRAGDEVQCRTYQNLFAVVVTYEAVMWALLVMDNV